MPPETPGEEMEGTVSLRDALSEAYDKVMAPEPAPEPTPTLEPTPPPPEPEPAPGPEAEPPAPSAPPPEPEAAIPERLKATLGEKWSTLDPTVREAFRGYETSIGQLANRYGKDAKAWNSTMEVYAPYEEMVRSEGGNFHGALANLFETARILRSGSPEQKVHLVDQIIQTFGVPYGRQPVGGGDPPAPTPTVDPTLINRLNNLEREVLTSRATASHNARARINEEVADFVARPDRPYCQEPGYLDTMGSLVSAGKATNLEDAYKQAAWLHEGTRLKEIARLNAERIASQATRTAQAKSAGSSVNGNAPGAVKRDASKMSLRETLSAAYDGDLE